MARNHIWKNVVFAKERPVTPRREHRLNHFYIKYHGAKREESQAIEDILLKLSALYAEIDDVASLPRRMGFDDKGSFELFTILTNRFSGIDKPLAKEFVTESTHQLKAKIYLGWQEIFQDVNRFKFDLQLLSVSDKYASLHLDLADNDELTNELMNAMIKFYSIN